MSFINRGSVSLIILACDVSRNAICFCEARTHERIDMRPYFQTGKERMRRGREGKIGPKVKSRPVPHAKSVFYLHFTHCVNKFTNTAEPRAEMTMFISPQVSKLTYYPPLAFRCSSSKLSFTQLIASIRGLIIHLWKRWAELRHTEL